MKGFTLFPSPAEPREGAEGEGAANAPLTAPEPNTAADWEGAAEAEAPLVAPDPNIDRGTGKLSPPSGTAPSPKDPGAAVFGDLLSGGGAAPWVAIGALAVDVAAGG